MAGLTRTKLARLAQSKRSDALLLLRNRRWSGAYYLYGFAVELAIKTVIAKSIMAQTIPEKSFANDFYTHDLPRLIAIAGLKDELAVELGNPAFKAAWEAVREWSIESRYDSIDEVRARAISAAVDDRRNGVFPWLKRRW